VQLGGTWTIADEYIQAGQNAQLRLLYHARDIHLVAGGTGTVSGTLDDSVLAKAIIDGEQLYTLSSTAYKDQVITLAVSPGVKLYSFTFG
jgi:hypothetical protein